MPSPLDNLVATGKLHAEPAVQAEIDGLLRSGAVRIADAEKPSNSLESRFDLAYNAAHALSLAALRRCGFRADNRYLVFQALPHSLDQPASVWRVLARAHELRIWAEYEGVVDIDERLLSDVLLATRAVLESLMATRQ